MRSAGVEREEVFRFFDADGQVVGGRTDPQPTYDPRTRPWYQSAQETADLIVTPLYIYDDGIVGATVARRVEGAGGIVVGTDITLAAISEYLAELRATWGYPLDVTIFDDSLRVVATSRSLDVQPGPDFMYVEDLADPALGAAVGRFGDLGGPYSYSTLQTPAGRVVASVERLDFEFGEGAKYMAIVAPL